MDGTVTAFRLTYELSYNSLILKIKSPYYTFYSRLLKENFHYISVKNDFSDLSDKITWCKTHDKECEKIANNAEKIYRKYVNRDTILNYLQLILVKISEKFK